MPERNFEALTLADRRALEGYESGYDWIPDRFGPPPGIPRDVKNRLDNLSDEEYMRRVIRMGSDRAYSLMVSEKERLRTYTHAHEIPDFIDRIFLARLGFYYTGHGDRVRCVFCDGTLGNWEEGDDAKTLHRTFFTRCKISQQKPCPNIPLTKDDGIGIAKRDVSMDCLQNDFSRMNIQSSRPQCATYRIPSQRLATYKHYSSSNPVKSNDLSEAGFYYEGPGDKVRCFWCNGSLELWDLGDDPWKEHAKWYPGCEFVQSVKGKEFIKVCRKNLSREDLQIADTLLYQKSDIDFLEESAISLTGEYEYEEFDTYQTCCSIGFTSEELKQAFNRNRGCDFSSIQVLIDVLYAQRRNYLSKLGEIDSEEKKRRKLNETSSLEYVDVSNIVNSDTLTKSEAETLIHAMTCSQCRFNQIGAMLLPCGHPTICQKCSKRRKLPMRCLACNAKVNGSCLIYLC